MGLFTKKRTAEPVPYDDALAYQLGSVHNLRANLWRLSDEIGWEDRSQPSPTLDAKLAWGTDTYGHRTVSVTVGKYLIGYLPRSANDDLVALIGKGPARGSVQMSEHGNTTTARCCVAGRS